MPHLLDASGHSWTVPPIQFRDVLAINAVLREGGEALSLPLNAQGEPLCDLHLPEVQDWFRSWPGAPIAVGAVLLKPLAEALQLSEADFAARWRGEAIDRLREAIWRELIDYFPSSARAVAQQIQQQGDKTRALAQAKIEEALELLTQTRAATIEQQLTRVRQELATLQTPTTTTGPGPSKRSGDSPDRCDSTRAGSACDSCVTSPSDCTSLNGTAPPGSPPRSSTTTDSHAPLSSRSASIPIDAP